MDFVPADKNITSKQSTFKLPLLALSQTPHKVND